MRPAGPGLGALLERDDGVVEELRDDAACERLDGGSLVRREVREATGLALELGLRELCEGGKLTWRRGQGWSASEDAARAVLSDFSVLLAARMQRIASSTARDAAAQAAVLRGDGPLVIDPTLAYSTYLGGSGDDQVHAIAVDAAGSAYVTGGTTSTNFPGAASPQGRSAGVPYVFVTKLSPAGDSLVYSTYLGSGGSGEAGGIAVDTSGGGGSGDYDSDDSSFSADAGDSDGGADSFG